MDCRECRERVSNNRMNDVLNWEERLNPARTGSYSI